MMLCNEKIIAYTAFVAVTTVTNFTDTQTLGLTRVEAPNQTPAQCPC